MPVRYNGRHKIAKKSHLSCEMTRSLVLDFSQGKNLQFGFIMFFSVDQDNLRLMKIEKLICGIYINIVQFRKVVM